MFRMPQLLDQLAKRFLLLGSTRFHLSCLRQPSLFLVFLCPLGSLLPSVRYTMIQLPLYKSCSSSHALNCWEILRRNSCPFARAVGNLVECSVPLAKPRLCCANVVGLRVKNTVLRKTMADFLVRKFVSAK